MDPPSASITDGGRRPHPRTATGSGDRRDGVDVGWGVRIPEDEIALLFSRSGGPGGQKVNTAATKVQVRFDVDGSAVLSDEQKRRVHDRLAGRLTADGVLVLHASEHRTQARNRAAAVARLRHLLHDALAPPAAPRRPTRRPPAADRRRLEAKRQRSDKKRLREAPRPPLD